jgi:hypothetical protein
MAPPDFRCPGTWRLSAGGIPIPPVPHGAARQAAIPRHYYEVLTSEERNDPLWDLDNEDQWTTFFAERRLQELVLRGQRPSASQQERRRAEAVVGRPQPHPRLGPRPHRRGQPPAADNAAAALAVAQDGRPCFVVLAFVLVGAEDSSARRRSRAHPARPAPG